MEKYTANKIEFLVDDIIERQVDLQKPSVSPDVRPGEEVVDLRLVFGAWWRGKWLILAVALLGSLYGLWNLWNFSPQYVATMVVAPSASGGLNAAMAGGQFGQMAGVAASFGIRLGGDQGVTTFDRLRLVMGTITLAKILQDKYGYLQKVYAGSWDPVSGKWLRPSGKRFEWEQRIRRLFHLRTWSEPTIETLAEYVGGAISIKRLKDVALQNISFTHVDRDFAVEFLSTVYNEADELLRQRDRLESAESKAYLRERLETTTMHEMRLVLIALLTQEERVAMLLWGDLPYAARVIEPLHVSERRTEPNVVLIVGAPASFALLGGLLLVTLIAVFRRE